MSDRACPDHVMRYGGCPDCRIDELETELERTEFVNVNDLRLQIADLETANQQLHHDLTASREIVALLQQDR